MKKSLLAALFATVLSPVAFAHEDPPGSGTFVNPVIEICVSEFGATPDDGNADTVAIQAAIDAAMKTGKHSLRFESGIYEIDDTIHIRRRQGLKITGEGALLWQRPDQPKISGQGTAIVWTGTDLTKPMFRYRGSELVMADIAIWGAEWSSTDPTSYAAYGFVSTVREAASGPDDENGETQNGETPDPVGVGAGKVNFHNVTFAFLEVGVHVSDPSTTDTDLEVNGDNLVFTGRTRFWHCETGLKTLSDQNMGFHFQNLHATKCEVVFDFYRGGGLKVERVLMQGDPASAQEPIYLRLEKPATNNGYFLTEFMKIDGGTKNPTIVDMVGTTNPQAKITFNHLHMSTANDYENTLFNLRGAAMLTVRDAVFRDKYNDPDPGQEGPAVLLDLTESGGGYRPNVHFDRVRFDGDAIDLVVEDATQGGFFFSGSNCLRTDGVPHNDWKFTEDSFPPSP